MNDKKEYDVICIGMALVDSIIKGFDSTPVSESGFRAASSTLAAGGEAVNEAVTASKLGLKTSIMCALGHDMAGSLVESFISGNGVDTSLILHPQEHSTPVTTMFVNDDGSRKSVTNRSHAFNFRPEEHTDKIKYARAVILGSLFRAPFDNLTSVKEVVECAHRNNTLIVADTKLPNFNFMGLEDVKEVLPLIDFITPNEDEGRYFTGKNTAEEMAQVFLSYGVKNVIIKLGSKGCYYSSSSTSFSLPSLNIKAVDATGAGDNFVAGLVSELLKGSDIHKAVEFANACGALCCTKVGACTALKNRDQVLSLMEA
ncbi:MAG: carbohydrate kinase family protein [Sphaerochaetaceae bacterium]|nr:carbohydrate kinase family protein [Sphaerochaetaceae bacterium]